MTHLDRDDELLRSLRDAMPTVYVLSGPDDPPHWACPGCGEPCYCVDPAARRAPHVACMASEEIA